MHLQSLGKQGKRKLERFVLVRGVKLERDSKGHETEEKVTVMFKQTLLLILNWKTFMVTSQ